MNEEGFKSMAELHSYLISENRRLQEYLESLPMSLVDLAKSGKLRPPQEISMCQFCLGIYKMANKMGEEAQDKGREKMTQVAKMFGKELGEEFLARIVGNKFDIKCRFTANGFQQTVVDGLWHDNDAFLSLLLTGKAEIVEDEK